MKITRIEKIKNHLIFKDFNWGTSLPDFKRFNLIYGWNGSGKTILSNLLRCIEKRKDVTIGEFSVVIDNKTVSSSSFSTDTSLPQIRVFNREFIEENIFTLTGEVSPIFYLGKESVEKQKEIETLRGKLAEKRKEYNKLREQKTKAENDLDQFNKDKAKFIKDLLSSSGYNPYNNYNKTSFKNKADELAKSANVQSTKLNNADKSRYKKQINEVPKPELTTLSIPILDTLDLLTRVNDVLAKTVVSEIIESLKNDINLSQWVRTGLDLHETSNSTKCLFCGQLMPNELLKRYRAHFNDKFNQFISEIELLSSEIQTIEDSLSKLNFYIKAELYEHLTSEYEQEKQKAKSDIETLIKYLNMLREKLLEKKNSPFQKMEPIVTTPPKNSELLINVNAIISRHNTETKNFQHTIAQARKKLEEDLVLESLDIFKKKNAEISKPVSEIQSAETDIKLLEENIAKSERQIIEHRRPADELNSELANYLGHTDLKFEIMENGYRIIRNGNPATGLSEGEKTAIAFLYFLKSLNDRAFKIKDGIIVIDDPVSSLDANSLFCAFGFMQTKVKDAGQLFILTHNFPFFRQIKHWYNSTAKKHSSYYMIECSYVQNDRCSKLLPLDLLLSKYDSEYHYLFKLVYSCAYQTEIPQKLETYYHLPNIARRLLESFLSFKHPKKAGLGLTDLLKETTFDEAKKSRILRFLHTHSHEGSIDDPEHDISILSETPQILRDVIKLIEENDKNHHDELVDLIKSMSQEETE
jgi:wobble nucleotide-excising tRNase